MLWLLALCVAATAGAWYWRKHSPELPGIEHLTSLRTNLPRMWTNLALPDLGQKSELSAAPATNAPAPAPAPFPGPVSTPQPTPPAEKPIPETPAMPMEKPGPPHPVRNVLEAQIALARLGISPGCIDGAWGTQTSRAILAYQIHHNLPVSGELDAETKAALQVEEPLFTHHRVTAEDLQRLSPVPSTWLGKSAQEKLDYESILELFAERGRSSVTFIRKLNPDLSWENITPGTIVQIPRIDPPSVKERAAFIRIHLYSKTLGVFDNSTNLLAHFPCSIAARIEKRPVGRLFVANIASNPNYLFNPELFAESPEARQIGRKLMIPPGPNNPVGTAWIGLDKPGYGIHGTPKPEQVGRTESHGCFRLANWNAEHLLHLVWSGMPVVVAP